MKRFDLNELGIQKMNFLEMKKNDGGLFGIDDFLLAVAAGAVIAIVNDWDNFERGLSGKPYKK